MNSFSLQQSEGKEEKEENITPKVFKKQAVMESVGSLNHLMLICNKNGIGIKYNSFMLQNMKNKAI